MMNPRKLSAATRSDLCGQCHGVSRRDFSRQSESNFLTMGCGFRPGNSLVDSDSLILVKADPESRASEEFKVWDGPQNRMAGFSWPDGEVRVSGREFNGLVESPCYQRGELGCVSCHSMHEKNETRRDDWRDDQLKPEMHGNRACTQCHSDVEKHGPAHTHHLHGSPGTECLNCHMPHTVYGLLKTIRSHRISSPSASVSVNTGRPNACNLCHLDKTLEWTADHLSDWFGQAVPELSANQRTISAALLDLLSGDAAQRAIQASAFGSDQAQKVSGTDWMPPALMIGIGDPYDAVRLISERSLRTIPEWSQFEVDVIGPPEIRAGIIGAAMGRLEKTLTGVPRPAVLFDENPRFNTNGAVELIQRRENRDVMLLE